MLSHANILANAQNIQPSDPDRQPHPVHPAAPMFHLADGAMTFLVTAYRRQPLPSCRDLIRAHF